MNSKYASRGGEKLEHALAQFNIDVKDKICADFGASTGGFTDCLLKHGAKKVYAVETGYGLLDWNLRNDARVVVMERTNAMHVELPELVDFISIDTSWTRQKNILPTALKFLKPGGEMISLLKPHYEAPRQWLKKGKVDEERLDEIVLMVKEELKEIKIKVKDIIKSPISGKKGDNIEYLVWIKN
ncbi:MAG: SAM-dependent methyltransferase [Patescibacteria group bacterium]|jgi:23S rRNA (cytidine1920-2'-O)/16S rRNA (cytidine1409-2'-O)-methyltransferase